MDAPASHDQRGIMWLPQVNINFAEGNPEHRANLMAIWNCFLFVSLSSYVFNFPI